MLKTAIVLLTFAGALAGCDEPVRYIVPDNPVEVVTVADLKGLEAIASTKFLHGLQIVQAIPREDGTFVVIFQWNLDAATAQRVELFR